MSICNPDIIFCGKKSSPNYLKLVNEAYCSSKILLYHSDSFDNLLKSQENEDLIPIEQDMSDTAIIVTSSGTSGFPKLVQISHDMLRTIFLMGGRGNEIGITKNDSLLHFLPFFHIFGCDILLASVFSNAKSVILERFVPDRVLQLIQDYKITKLCVVPPVVVLLAKHPLVEQYDYSSLSDMICGAACLKKDLEEQVQAKFNLKCVRQIYGCSEIGGLALLIPKNQPRAGSVGKPTSKMKVKICDPITGALLGANQIGEVLIKNSSAVPGYLGNPKEAVNAFDSENFFRSGDSGYYDEDGFFFIVDRLKEIIKYKAFQVTIFF